MKYLKYALLPLLSILIMAAIPKSNKSFTNKQMIEIEDDLFPIIDSFQLLKNNCLICHGAGSSHDNMLAPPMHAVKNHYWSSETTEEEFVKDIMSWVHNPSEEKVQMPGAVNKFNIMPKISVSDSDLRAIACYIYKNDIEKPAWCGNNEINSTTVMNPNSPMGQACNKQKGNGCCSGNKSQGCNHGPKKRNCNSK